MRSAAQRRGVSDPVAIRDLLESFLRACRQPAVYEPGEEPIPVEADNHSLAARPNGCLLEIWGPAGSLTRRVTAVVSETKQGLELLVHRFGGREGTLWMVDLERQSARFDAAAQTRQFAKALEGFVARALPAARLQELTVGADLERSLSAVYPRGILVEDGRRWAFLASPPAAGAAGADGALAFGLLWLDALRRSRRGQAVAGLALCLPRPHVAVTAARLACLDRELASYRLFALEGRGLKPVDPHDHGNLSSELPVCFPPAVPDGPTARLFEALRREEGVAVTPRPDGMLTLHVRGLVVAEVGHRLATFGLARQTPLRPGNLDEALRLIREIAEVRRPEAAARNHALYNLYPELWLEAQVRADSQALDPSFRVQPWYSRTPATLGGDRGVLDLLGIDRDGRLAVLELKTEEELRLPIQALDYWLRVERHRQRGDFSAKGFFPGLAIADAPARLILVAPALKFHPQTETLLRWLHPRIPLERIGLTADWRNRPAPVFRAVGADAPGSKGVPSPIRPDL
ncbi:MAG: hypothetical protein GC160_27125 [Acidobacteria bacterium]|nr:hypothetical protein [Acidobacteriota bacterium]